MTAIWAVFKREVGRYFRSIIAYAIAFALLLLIGFIFSGYLVQANGAAPAEPGLAPQILTTFMFVIGPLLTMRLLAEEAREGTLEVLMTLPVNDSTIVLGKFFAAWFYFTLLLAITLIHYVIWTLVGIPDAGLAFSAYLGAWLYGGAVIALSMIWTAVTEDQMVAAFLSAATILILYFNEFAANAISGTGAGSEGAAELVRELGLAAHYDATMLNGVIRAEDIAYFLFLIIAALFITTRVVEIRRWRA